MTTKILFLRDSLSGLTPLAKMSDAAISELRDLLSKDAPDGVEEIVLRISNALRSSEDDSLSLYRSLNYVAGEAADAHLTADTVIDELITAIRNSTLDDEIKRGLSDLLSRKSEPLLALFDPYGRWRTVRKKYDLLAGVVNSVASVRTICDLRPIFDERRESIVDSGVTVTIEFLVINREGHAQQVVLSSNVTMLDTILEKLTLARKKVDTIRATYSKGGTS